MSAIELVAGVIETFGFGFREVMAMPFRTFMAFNRLASTRNTNAQIRKQFGR